MTIHIYIVDDDPVNLQIASHILNKDNITATTLTSGQALLESINPDALPDLILLDINMPEMDGFETLEHLRQKEKALHINEIPVIFLTADETADTEKHGFEAGVSDYIRKPFDPDILLRRVHNIVSKEKRLSSLRTEADTDKLTGFLNKAASARVISEMCTSASGCLMMIDLDSFKLVNDLYGHKMGDNFLSACADIMRNALPAGSRLGRIGGDEFIAFLIGIQTEEQIDAITQRINDTLLAKAKSLMGEDNGIPLGASIGAVIVTQSGEDYDTLFRHADKALYSVKKNGKHGYAIYHAKTDSEDNAEKTAHDIGRLSEILGERSIPNVALELDKDAFSYVYRYLMRYLLRNQQCMYKVLFTLYPEADTDEHTYKELCEAFGDLTRESLRKTDVLMRNRFNQFFVLLTDIKENDITIVIGNLMRRWERNGGSGIRISYESEFVRVSPVQRRQNNDLRLALVDDYEPFLHQTGTILSKAGYHVAAMRSGKALLKYLINNTPDLILLDVEMPEMNGFETLHELRKINGASEIPVVFLTADDEPSTERKCFASGADDMIRKPFTPELLLHRIRRVTELSELRRTTQGYMK